MLNHQFQRSFSVLVWIQTVWDQQTPANHEMHSALPLSTLFNTLLVLQCYPVVLYSVNADSGRAENSPLFSWQVNCPRETSQTPEVQSEATLRV